MLSIHPRLDETKCDRHLWYDCSWWPKALYVFVMARPKLRALRQMPMTTRICENVIFSPQNFKEFLSGSYVEIETAHNERRKIMTKQHILKKKKKKKGQREGVVCGTNKIFIMRQNLSYCLVFQILNLNHAIKKTQEIYTQ